MNDISASERIAILERRLRRATVAREGAESILERRSRELVYLNEKLSAREDELKRTDLGAVEIADDLVSLLPYKLRKVLSLT